ncbi:hypothetical protein GCM10007968_27590 [Sporolactobacillus putidus]|uniref:Uncharacterized protein n=1 Tax=Sporolactobacillus putidus TaxID=492735 RepID=A0A917S8W5_9BACL|nr:hypothetical protein GCM10007968_27590 [Sporolactobacillus putidus]
MHNNDRGEYSHENNSIGSIIVLIDRHRLESPQSMKDFVQALPLYNIAQRGFEVYPG